MNIDINFHADTGNDAGGKADIIEARERNGLAWLVLKNPERTETLDSVNVYGFLTRETASQIVGTLIRAYGIERVKDPSDRVPALDQLPDPSAKEKELAAQLAEAVELLNCCAEGLDLESPGAIEMAETIKKFGLDKTIAQGSQETDARETGPSTLPLDTEADLHTGPLTGKATNHTKERDKAPLRSPHVDYGRASSEAPLGVGGDAASGAD